MNHTRHKQLLQKYRTNHLTSSEYEEFLDILKKNGSIDGAVLDEQAKADWQPSHDLLKNYFREVRQQQRRKRILMWSWSSAAALALLIMAYLFLRPGGQIENVVYRTSYGETKNITLPDGSNILLNANTSLTWNGDWKKAAQRNAVLEGEAYFEVQNIEDMPFTVTASGVEIHVIGTQFNVRNREANTEVFLHEGKVELQLRNNREPQLAGSEKNMVTLQPGDFARIDNSKQELIIENNNQIEKKAAWVDGMLDFENKTVVDILKEFEEIYGKKFIIENSELADRRMDLSLPYSDWELVRKALEIAIGADFEIEQDTITVK